MYFRAYDSPDVMNLNKLCILAGKTCWILYVDILILGKILTVFFHWRIFPFTRQQGGGVNTRCQNY